MKQLWQITLTVACLLASDRCLADEKSKKEWPFYAPGEAALPEVSSDPWVRNGIDAFALEKLQEAGLRPAPEASRRQLVRRLYLDLIGLPPSPAELDAFLSDSSQDAYVKLVDRLLKLSLIHI